jgi:hypothetical protein
MRNLVDFQAAGPDQELLVGGGVVDLAEDVVDGGGNHPCLLVTTTTSLHRERLPRARLAVREDGAVEALGNGNFN